MKKLKVNLEDIAFAMETEFFIEPAYQYLDTDTGEVVLVTVSILREVEEEEVEEIDDSSEDPVRALHELNPSYEDERALALLIFNDTRDRFEEIPHLYSSESYEIMEDFITTIKSDKIQEALFRAIRGRKPFRKFKDTISQWPDILEDWFKYQKERMDQIVIKWLASIDIEPE